MYVWRGYTRHATKQYPHTSLHTPLTQTLLHTRLWDLEMFAKTIHQTQVDACSVFKQHIIMKSKNNNWERTTQKLTLAIVA